MSPPARSATLDLARLLAMLMMGAYHLSFDLSAFYGWDMDLASPGWHLLQRSTLILFLLVSGVSATVRRMRIIQRDEPSNFQRSRHCSDLPASEVEWRRPLILLSCALLITLVTLLLFPGQYIRFGVLHCLAFSALLLPAFLPLKLWNALAGLGVIMLAGFLPSLLTGHTLLLPLGLPPPGFASLDYVPLVPWFGFVLLGAALGDLLAGPRLAALDHLLPHWTGALSRGGRYSLLFYLLHQPVLLAVLWILFGPSRFH